MAGTRDAVPRRCAGALTAIGALALVAAAIPTRAAGDATGRIERIELATDAASTKVVVVLSRPIAFDVKVLDGDPVTQGARRLVLDFPDTTLAPAATKPIAAGTDLLHQVRTGQFNARTARIVLELGAAATHSVDAVETPPHVTIALAGPASGGAAPAAATTGAGGSPAAGAGVPPAAGAGAPPAADAAPGVGAAPAGDTPPAAGAPLAATTGAAAPPAAAASPAAETPPAGTAAAAAAAGTATSKTPARTIPIRARGRRPYSLNYGR